MTDRELLEGAARAAGIRLDWWEWPKALRGIRGPLTDEPDEFDCVYWNPLEDDGDAFRLLHIIQADLHHGENELGETIVTIQPFNVPFSESPWCEAYDIAGLRRAIVRAAAAMYNP